MTLFQKFMGKRKEWNFILPLQNNRNMRVGLRPENISLQIKALVIKRQNREVVLGNQTIIKIIFHHNVKRKTVHFTFIHKFKKKSE